MYISSSASDNRLRNEISKNQPQRPRVRSIALSMAVLLFPIFAGAQAFLDGTVRNTSGVPLAAVQVKLQRDDSVQSRQAETGADGRFRFGSIEAGGYSLSTEAAEYFPATHQFVVSAREPRVSTGEE